MELVVWEVLLWSAIIGNTEGRILAIKFQRMA
jgi:hypothetical protein